MSGSGKTGEAQNVQMFSSAFMSTRPLVNEPSQWQAYPGVELFEGVDQRDKISILCPRDNGTYVVEFRTAEGKKLAITVPSTKAAVLKHFQAATAARNTRRKWERLAVLGTLTRQMMIGLTL
jgi:hypothetical protein